MAGPMRRLSQTSTGQGPDPDAPLGAKDAFVEKGLRKWGVTMLSSPGQGGAWACLWVLILLGLSCGWFTREIVGGSKAILNPGQMELQWSIPGGKTQRALELMKTKTPNTKKASTTMFRMKDGSDDMAKEEVLEEILQLMKEGMMFTASVNNKTYTYYDLCARGSLPDIPPGLNPAMPDGSAKFPCFNMAPFHCFRETHELSDPSYQAIDPFIGSVFPGSIPYTTRPSFRNATPAEIKKVLATPFNPNLTEGKQGVLRGCYGSGNTMKLAVDQWGGKLVWNGGEIEKVGAIRLTSLLDGTMPIKLRLAGTKPAHCVDDDIENAVKIMSDKWHEHCKTWSKKSKLLEVVYLKDMAYYGQEEIAEEVGQFQWQFLVIGIVLLHVFLVSILANCKYPLASRLKVGLDGMGVVGLGQMASYGTFFLCGYYFNEPIMMGLPLLGAGLGVNDMFVMIRYFSGLGREFIDKKTPAEVAGELMAQAGPGTLLSSACNSLTFAAGSFLPIQGLADFCFGALLIAVFNYLAMMNVFVPHLVRTECARIAARGVERGCPTAICQKKRLALDPRPDDVLAVSANEYDSCDKRFTNFLFNSYAPFMARPLVRILTSVCALGLLAYSFVLIEGKKVGYSPSEIFAEGNDYNIAFKMIFQDFGLFPAQLVFDDIDVAKNQAEMLKLYDGLTTAKFGIPGLFPPYLTIFSLAGMPYGGSPCSTLGGPYTCDMNYMHPVLAPVGTVPAEHFEDVFYEWGQPPANPFDLWAGKLGYTFADQSGLPFYRWKNETNPETGITSMRMTYSFFDFFQNFPYVEGQNNEDLFIDAIIEGKQLIDASPIGDKCLLYGSTTTFWEVFLDLDVQLYKLIGISAGMVFLATFFILNFDIVVAVVTTLSVLMITVEVYGITVYFMSFNVYVAAFVLMGMGIAVEFTAHQAAAFAHGTGSCAERLGKALVQTFPPLFDGSVSSLISQLPLAFHAALFIVKYLFGTVAIVIGVGLLNGIIVMPGLLAVLSPLANLQDKVRGRTSLIELLEAPDPEEVKSTEKKEQAAKAEDEEDGAGGVDRDSIIV